MPAITGQGICGGIGAASPKPTVSLRSNKSKAALLVNPLSGQQVQSGGGSLRASRARLLTGMGISTAQHSFFGTQPGVVWDIGDIALQYGQSGQPDGQCAGSWPNWSKRAESGSAYPP